MFRVLLFSFLVLLSCKEENPYGDFGGDFTLASKNGPWKLSETNGKVRILYFGFTHCPDVCPLSLSKLKKELKKLTQKQREKILPVFISVDYKRDKPDRVQEYATFFGDDFIGLTGNEKEIRDVAKKYGVYFEFTPLKDSKMGYTVDHTSRFFLINKKGKYANSFSDIQDNKDFIEELKKLTGE